MIQIGSALLLAITMLTAGMTKIQVFETLSWFVRQFQETPLNLFEGSLTLQFYAIAVLEIVIGLCALVSLLNTKIKTSLLQGSLFSSAILFAGLSFGQRMTHKFEDAAFLFLYSATSLILLSLQSFEKEKA